MKITPAPRDQQWLLNIIEMDVKEVIATFTEQEKYIVYLSKLSDDEFAAACPI